jgi:hypothetical protein
VRQRLTRHDEPASLAGAGLGLRRGYLQELVDLPAGRIDFLELAPENWIGVGGRLGRAFASLAERYPLALHGLSLDIGGSDPLDRELLAGVRRLMDRYPVALYSEHLSFCAHEGHLYDLLPLPFTEAAVRHVAERVGIVQDIIGKPLVLENASYYAPAADGEGMDEADFIAEVAERSGCELLLDVNNVYVNSINHGYDARAFIERLPLARVRYLHLAGHYDEADDLKIDTHGMPVVEPVWDLLASVYARLGAVPTLLERDVNLPPLATLLDEVARVRALQADAPAALAS